MVEPLLVVQGVVGGVLFFLTGYLLSLVFFKEQDIDSVERVVYSLTFSIVIPAIAVFLLNIGLGIPIFSTLGIYAVFLGLSGASLLFLQSQNRLPQALKPKRRKG